MSTSADGSADRAARERLAGEARATAASMLDWLGSRVDAQAAAASSDARPPQSAGPCTWCPVCALVAALRGEAPELTARTAEQVSGLLVLLRLVLAEHGGHQHTAPAPPAPFAPEPAADPPEHPLHATFDPTPPAPWSAPRRASPPLGEGHLGPTGLVEGHLRPGTQAAEPAERPTGRRAPRPSPRRPTGPGAPADPGPEDSVGGRGTGFGAPEPGLADPVGTRRRGVGDRDPATAAPPSPPSRSQRRVVQRIPIRRVSPPGSC